MGIGNGASLGIAPGFQAWLEGCGKAGARPGGEETRAATLADAFGLIEAQREALDAASASLVAAWQAIAKLQEEVAALRRPVAWEAGEPGGEAVSLAVQQAPPRRLPKAWRKPFFGQR